VSTESAVAVAMTFVWLGMVLAISGLALFVAGILLLTV